MITSACSTVSKSANKSHDQLFAELLRAAFDFEFEFFDFSNGSWAMDSAPSLFADVAEQLADIAREAAPTFVGPHGNGWLAIPLNWDDEWMLAVSKSTMPFSTQTMRTASVIQENIGLRCQVDQQKENADQFAIQISRDFEELTFLQRMVESLEFAAADASFTEVTDTIFAMLLPAIEAKTIIFLPSEDSARDGHPWRMIGESVRVPWSSVFAEIEQLSEPLVRNRIENERYPELRQFVAVQIKNKERTYGWLVAANRDEGVNCHLDGSQSEAEFGTYEGSLLSSAAAVIATYGLNRELLQRKEKLLVELVRCLVSAIDAKDDYTRGHSVRVAQFARCLAEHLDWSDERCEQIYMAGLLHDVGKIGVPDAVLKKPGMLDDSERKLIQRHPDHGWSILHSLEEIHHVLPGVVHHHEEFDGQGYPDRLSGEQIPIEGRLLAIVDAYDAIVSDRSYRSGRPHEEAVRILVEGSGKQWDPDIVAAFVTASDAIQRLSASYHHEPQPVRTPTRG